MLLVALVMLLLISLIAVGGIQGTILQERMTTNMRDRDLAFQAAEAAMRDAERYLREQGLGLNISNANGVYDMGHDNRPEWDTQNTSEGSGAQEYRGDFGAVSAQPEYYIEQLPPFWGQSLSVPFDELSPFFRITARGFGGSSNTSVVLSSVYKAW